VLEYASFMRKVVELLEVEQTNTFNPYDSLYEEVGLDSLQAFQLVVIIESLADATPVDDIPELYTMQDAFEYYASLCSNGA
jgi:acyl carrier protein